MHPRRPTRREPQSHVFKMQAVFFRLLIDHHAFSGDHLIVAVAETDGEMLGGKSARGREREDTQEARERPGHECRST